MLHRLLASSAKKRPSALEARCVSRRLETFREVSMSEACRTLWDEAPEVQDIVGPQAIANLAAGAVSKNTHHHVQFLHVTFLYFLHFCRFLPLPHFIRCFTFFHLLRFLYFPNFLRSLYFLYCLHLCHFSLRPLLPPLP